MALADVFRTCKAEKRPAIMPFLTAGFPSEKAFARILRAVARSGADMIEIGIPFSDPLADGKAIQMSSQTALANGITAERALRLCRSAMDGCRVPLVMMSYYNPVLACGRRRLVQKMRASGFQGMIIPDLVPEEGEAMRTVCRKEDIDLVYLLAPTSTEARRARIIRQSSGFVYLVSVAGVTGARKTLPRSLTKWIRQVKTECPLPVCVGFGISTLRQAKELSRVADGIIIGSALVDIMVRATGTRQMSKEVGGFIARLRRGG